MRDPDRKAPRPPLSPRARRAGRVLVAGLVGACLGAVLGPLGSLACAVLGARLAFEPETI